MTVEPWIKTGHCQTRDGREVRIYATDGGRPYPVHGAVLFQGDWRPKEWTAKGEYVVTTFSGHDNDLVPIETTKREVWYCRCGVHGGDVDLNVTRDHEGRVTKVELAE